MPSLTVVLDAMVIARGLVGRRPSSAAARALRYWRLGLFDVATNGILVDEVARTLRNLRVRDELIEELSGELCSPERIVAIRHQAMGCRDRRDDHLLETAILAKAQVLVSCDRDVLELPTYAEQFLRRAGVRVMSIAEFVEFLDAKLFSPLSYGEAAPLETL